MGNDGELPEWVKPGASFSYEYGEGNHNTGRLFHVRGIVDGLAVIREWSKTKRRWRYTTEDGCYFAMFSAHIVIRRAA